jgi:hypothetical protein
MVLDTPGRLAGKDHLIHVQIIDGTILDIVVDGDEGGNKEYEHPYEKCDDGFPESQDAPSLPVFRKLACLSVNIILPLHRVNACGSRVCVPWS